MLCFIMTEKKQIIIYLFLLLFKILIIKRNKERKRTERRSKEKLIQSILEMINDVNKVELDEKTKKSQQKPICKSNNNFTANVEPQPVTKNIQYMLLFLPVSNIIFMLKELFHA